MSDISPGTCPKCGAPEVERNSPRTYYACGSNDYDQRPGTFIPGDSCKSNISPKAREAAEDTNSLIFELTESIGPISTFRDRSKRIKEWLGKHGFTRALAFQNKELERYRSDWQKVVGAVLECEPMPACKRDDDQLEPPWEVIKRLSRALTAQAEELARLREVGRVSCVGNGTTDSGCGQNGGLSGFTCPKCGGMLLSDKARLEAQSNALASLGTENERLTRENAEFRKENLQQGERINAMREERAENEDRIATLEQQARESAVYIKHLKEQNALLLSNNESLNVEATALQQQAREMSAALRIARPYVESASTKLYDGTNGHGIRMEAIARLRQIDAATAATNEGGSEG